ncbi:MAG: hypothetical protein II244_06415 [Clostridia bacterium]|nr:hypothetical protein [Clostridia bacterium]
MARPPKYKKEYCQKMYDFFNIEHTFFEEVTKIDKKGDIQTYTIEKPNKLPTFEKFGTIIKVHRDTLNEWTRQYKEFSDTYKLCKDMQKDMLIDLGIRGFYNPVFTQFVAKNITDMKDKVEQEVTNKTPQIVVATQTDADYLKKIADVKINKDVL